MHPAIDTGASQCAQIHDLLHRHAGAWVSLPELAAVSGSMAVHSRISDLRAAGHSIQHRNQRVGRRVHSSYRLQLESQPTLF